MKKIIIVGIIIIVALTFSIIEIVKIKDNLEEYQIQFDNAIECYEAPGQCGIHNILEESELETASIKINIEWLENNQIQIDEYYIQKGINVAKYLISLRYEKREIFIREVQEAVLEEDNS